MTLQAKSYALRLRVLDMVYRAKTGHIGGDFSVCDILNVLYNRVMDVTPENFSTVDHDHFILSKGHSVEALYSVLCDRGFFPEKDLETFSQFGSKYIGHPNNKVLGIEMNSGSLGHGLCAAVGMALAAKQDGKHHRVFAVLGDGECDEGSVWEAALFANQYRLENLVAIIDHNHMQSLDTCEKTLELEDFGAKWRAFGWNVIELNGHDHNALRSALTDTRNAGHKPTVVIANTVKGKGVSFMENDILWHYRFPHDGWEYDGAVTELHAAKPAGVEDPYTPDGIADPVKPGPDADIGNDHTASAGWHPTYIAKEV